jgi:hypothetical protein
MSCKAICKTGKKCVNRAKKHNLCGVHEKSSVNFSFGDLPNELLLNIFKFSSDSELFMVIISDPRLREVAAYELIKRHRKLTNDKIFEYGRLIKSSIKGLNHKDPYVQNYIKYLTEVYVNDGEWADSMPYDMWRRSLRRGD